MLLLGAVVELRIVLDWIASGYGELMAVREVVLGMAPLVLGLQTIFASFLISLMRIPRR